MRKYGLLNEHFKKKLFMPTFTMIYTCTLIDIASLEALTVETAIS